MTASPAHSGEGRVTDDLFPFCVPLHGGKSDLSRVECKRKGESAAETGAVRHTLRPAVLLFGWLCTPALVRRACLLLLAYGSRECFFSRVSVSKCSMQRKDGCSREESGTESTVSKVTRSESLVGFRSAFGPTFGASTREGSQPNLVTGTRLADALPTLRPAGDRQQTHMK